MKKSNLVFFLMASVVMLAMVGCQKDTVSIKARIAGFGDAKTYMGGQNYRTPMWNDNDEIWINGVGYGISSIDGGIAEFAGVERTGDYRAIYPSSIVTGANDPNSPNIAISLPGEQPYVAAAGNQIVTAPMAAHTTDNSNHPQVSFTNLGAVLAIQVTNNTTNTRSADLQIEKIEVTSASNNMALWGDGVIENINSDNRKYVINETLTGADDEHLTVELTGISGVTLHQQASATTPQHTFYIYVPAATGDVLNRFKITVYATSRAGSFTYTREQSANGNGNFDVNEMAYFPFDLASTTEDFEANAIPDGALPGLFTVAEGVQVYFSMGNLRYLRDENCFDFAHSQFEMLDYGTNPTGLYDNDGIMELFGWATSGYCDPNDASATCYLPYETSDASSSYGPAGNNANGVHLSDNYRFDWGSQIGEFGTWRTLSQDEWDYLLNSRTANHDDSYRRAMVGDLKGVIIFPDNFHGQSEICSHGQDSHGDGYYIVNAADLTANNIVFLPSTGSRIRGNWADGFGYWTATASLRYGRNLLRGQAQCLVLGTVPYFEPITRSTGYAVRLVANAAQ